MSDALQRPKGVGHLPKADSDPKISDGPPHRALSLPQVKSTPASRQPLKYLRQDIQLEPLCDQWYAWSHLIPPVTSARNLTERHLRILDSYISAPQVHANAVKNPKMAGGPFIDLGGQRVEELKALRDETKKKRLGLLELSTAIEELDLILRTSAKGGSLHALYTRIPAVLRGYVELVYDLNNHPSFRLIEPLLYKSKYYDPTAQSFMLSIIGSDDRPFALSTPRLKSIDNLHLRLTFNDARVDELLRLKSQPASAQSICDMFDITHEEARLLESFLTLEEPPQYKCYSGPGARWRYFGHACILLETGGISILVDPVLSYTYESEISRYTYLDLPETIDCVLITHNHQDHVLLETLLQIRHKVKLIVVPRNGGGALQDPSLKLILENCGFRSVVELSEFGTFQWESVSITGLPFFGEHSDLDVQTKLAYLIEIQQHKLLFAADSCNIEPKLYEHVHQEIGDIDVLFLGMECDGAPLTWVYGPLLTQRLEYSADQERRLSGSNFAQAANIVDQLRCKEVYVYAMGQEPWLNYIMSLKYTAESRPIVESNRLIEYCKSRGLVAERLFGEKEILIQP